MSVKSIFEFKFPAETRGEGLGLAKAIGNDMPVLAGYLDHEVIQDFTDAGHLMVVTRWGTRQQAEAVLGTYQNDAKIKQVTKLLPEPPNGFIGDVLS